MTTKTGKKASKSNAAPKVKGKRKMASPPPQPEPKVTKCPTRAAKGANTPNVKIAAEQAKAKEKDIPAFLDRSKPEVAAKAAAGRENVAQSLRERAREAAKAAQAAREQKAKRTRGRSTKDMEARRKIVDKALSKSGVTSKEICSLLNWESCSAKNQIKASAKLIGKRIAGIKKGERDDKRGVIYHATAA